MPIRNISWNYALFALILTTLFHDSFAFGAEPSTTNSIVIQTYTNSDTLYTEYSFAVSQIGKKLGKADWNNFGTERIEWDVIDRATNPKPKKYIRVWLYETGPFSANVETHKALMRKIFSRWPVSDFDSIEFLGSFDGASDWSWGTAIAAASSKSEDYKDYKVNYPHSKITELFGLYKQLVVETKVYYPLRDIFREAGADIDFECGEKHVLNAKAEELPFYPQLKAMGISGKTRVIYDALGNAFTIKPWPNTVTKRKNQLTKSPLEGSGLAKSFQTPYFFSSLDSAGPASAGLVSSAVAVSGSAGVAGVKSTHSRMARGAASPWRCSILMMRV